MTSFSPETVKGQHSVPQRNVLRLLSAGRDCDHQDLNMSTLAWVFSMSPRPRAHHPLASVAPAGLCCWRAVRAHPILTSHMGVRSAHAWRPSLGHVPGVHREDGRCRGSNSLFSRSLPSVFSTAILGATISSSTSPLRFSSFGCIRWLWCESLGPHCSWQQVVVRIKQVHPRGIQQSSKGSHPLSKEGCTGSRRYCTVTAWSFQL